jgi:5-methylthioribose kinase
MTDVNNSYILTQDTVASYVSKHAFEIKVFPPSATLTAEAIQGGNVNFAFCVRSSDGKAVFVKQAPEYVAVFGPDGLPLTSNRIQKEVSIIKEWTSILGDDADTYVPKLYYFDDENKVFVMEFLENFDLLDHHLVTSPTLASEVSIASQLGKFMAQTHLATHSSKVSADRVDFLTSEYENRALRDIQLEYVFTKAYKEVSQTTTKGFQADEAFLAEVNALKSRYNGEVGAGNMSLCHGDLHPGSVMVKVSANESEEAQVRVTDPEFTVYGPPGLDVGSLLSGYVLGAVRQSFATENHEEKMNNVKAISEGVVAAWESYKSNMLKGGISDEIMKEIEIETVGFAVAEVCRTALGFAGIRLWLQFDDENVKEEAVQTSLSIVQKCMTGRHTKGIQCLFDCLTELSK